MGGKKGFLDCLDLFLFFWIINAEITERCKDCECGEITHISQESDSTSVLTGKSVREIEAPIENLNRADEMLGHGPDQLQVTTGGIAEPCVMGGTTKLAGD